MSDKQVPSKQEPLVGLRKQINQIDERIILQLERIQQVGGESKLGDEPNTTLIKGFIAGIPHESDRIIKDDLIAELITCVISCCCLQQCQRLYLQVKGEIVKLIKLVNQRMRMTIGIGEIKRLYGLSIENRQREEEIIDRMTWHGIDEGLDLGLVENVWRILIKHSKQEQQRQLELCQRCEER